MSEYLGIYPSSLERKKSHAAYKDDSDDEKITGPPKLSDFGAALLMEKENMAPSMVRRGEPSPNSFKRELKTRFGPTNTDYFSGSNNQTSFSQTYVSANSGEPSQSTIFAQSRFNQQPSMTTMEYATEYEGRTYYKTRAEEKPAVLTWNQDRRFRTS